MIPCFMGVAAYVFLTQAGAVFLDGGAFSSGEVVGQAVDYNG